MNDLARIRFDRDEKILTATIAGEIDISNTSELRRSIDAQLQLADTTTVIIDLSATTFVDSTGVGLLFDMASRLRTTRRTLYLVIPADAPICRIATLTRLNEEVAVLPKLSDATALHETPEPEQSEAN
jgi:anti-sigma B factor antagonist